MKKIVLLTLLTLACDRQSAGPAPSSVSFEEFQQAACRHEAGHALYATQFPKHLRLVSVYLLDDARGRHGAYTEFKIIDRPGDIRQTVVLVGMKLAGEVSEEILNGAALTGNSSDDWTEATELATRLLDGNPANVPHVLAAAKRLARDVLAPHAGELRQIADEIYRRKRLTARNIQHVVNGH